MEKIIEFKKGKVFKGHSKIYRFQCDCLTPADAMDITVDSYGKNDEGKYYIIQMNFIGTSFIDRVKYAFQIIKGNWAWREFVIREEDLKSLVDILNPDKKFSELP